jgi:hypothetical protein
VPDWEDGVSALGGPMTTRDGADVRLVNMENFITGYPGHEYQARAAIKKAIGEEKYEFFFDKVGRRRAW